MKSIDLNCLKHNRHLGFLWLFDLNIVLGFALRLFKSNNHRVLGVYLTHNPIPLKRTVSRFSLLWLKFIFLKSKGVLPGSRQHGGEGVKTMSGRLSNSAIEPKNTAVPRGVPQSRDIFWEMSKITQWWLSHFKIQESTMLGGIVSCLASDHWRKILGEKENLGWKLFWAAARRD